MSQEFKVGDVVQLKSGGPKMTVTDAKTDFGDVKCAWFDKDGNRQEARFPSETLGKPGSSFAVA